MEPCLTMEHREIVAAAMHAAWYAYAVLAMGEAGEPWPTAPEWQKASCRDGADCHYRLLCKGYAPSEWPRHSHENWMRLRESQGWVYDEIKDVERKTSPCMVPYEQLPESQRRKDDVAVQATVAMFVALGLVGK